MKNLVMGVATNYSWYDLEPFVISFKRYCKDADIVLFVDNISDFTRDALTRGGVELLPVPAELKSALIIDARWSMYKNFLDARGKDYKQVFLADTRDVVCQSNLFDAYANYSSFFGYTTEGANIKNPMENLTYTWLTNLRGKDEAEKLGDRKIICCGTVLGTTREVTHFAGEMWEILKNGSTPGDEQAAMNYLVYENLLPFENIQEIDCWSGNIFTSFLFNIVHPIGISGDKIQRGDGGTPAVVHQYDRFPVLVQLVHRIYCEENLQPNENFSDLRSIFEQILCMANCGKIDDAYKLFTKYLHNAEFNFQINKLLTLFDIILTKSEQFTPSLELFFMSLQWAFTKIPMQEISSISQINQLYNYTNAFLKNNIAMTLPFKILVKNIFSDWANHLYKDNQFEQSAAFMELAVSLNVPLDDKFYLLQAEVYRKLGRKTEALASYEKALNT